MKNYHLPPEWAPQSGVLLTWPNHNSPWVPSLEAADQVFAAIAKAVTQQQHLVISCLDNEHRKHVEKLLQTLDLPMNRIKLFIVPSNDAWVRDHGPITVYENGNPRLLNFKFNAWGSKYAANHDDFVVRKLHEQNAFNDIPLERHEFVLEGGSIEVDGQGTLLTTRSCLLANTRNPQHSPAEIAAKLKTLLGITRILWLAHGFQAGDDTDGHIDTLARFTDPHTIVYVSCNDPQDEHYAELQAMAEELRQFTHYQGQPYRLVPLPMPKPYYSADGQRLPATYANFLIINGAVLVPTYADSADEIAKERLQSCFPDRQIIGIDCRTLIEQYGSLHCVTMQIPAGVW